MTNDTPNTPTTFNKAFMNALLSMKFLADLLPVLNSLVLTLSILMPLSSLGSRLTIFAYDTITVLALLLTPPLPPLPYYFPNHKDETSTYISRQQTIDSERSPLTLIIRPEHNGNILDANHQRQGPDDQGEGAEKVIPAGLGAEG